MPVISARDAVTKMTISDYDGGKFIIAETVDHPAKPVQQGIVRIFTHTRYLIRPSKTEYGVYEYSELSLFNFGGYFPTRLWNMIIGSVTQSEFESMVKQCQKKKQEKELNFDQPTLPSLKSNSLF